MTSTLSRLFKDGYLENVFRSNSYTGYRLNELGRKLAEGAKEEVSNTKAPDEKLGLSEGLFEESSAMTTSSNC